MTDPSIGPAEEAASRSLFEFLLRQLQERDGRIRAEDVLSAAAAIVAMRCIEAAGDFDPRNHQFTPGERVFSDRVNELFCGERSLAETPPETIVGILRGRLVGKGYSLEDFPDLTAVFEGFAARIGDPADWGRTPLSVPEDNRPDILPMQIEYETRTAVDRLFAPLGGDRMRCLTAATLALAEALIAVEDVIDHRVALLLALETVNGMAKTAPMTDQAYAEVAGQAPSQPVQKRPWWRFW